MCAWSKNRICQVDYIPTKGMVMTTVEHQLDKSGHVQSEKENQNCNLAYTGSEHGQ
jgi:hypothetical protein